MRARELKVGMTPEMARLALGDAPYELDEELLEDGTVQETWKVIMQGDTRHAVMSGSSLSFGAIIGTATTSSGYVQHRGLPPVLLRVVFRNGKLVSHKTEYI